MNNKLFRRLLAVTMVASLVIMPLTVGATDSPSQSSEETTVTTEEAKVVETSSQVVSSDGTAVKNELPGAFVIEKSSPVTGIAVTETPKQVQAAAGLADNQKPFVKGYSLDRKKSDKAFASFDAGAALVGGKTLGGLNLDFGALTNGKFTELPEGVELPVTIGIKNYNPNLTYYIVKVSKGGKIELIPVKVEKGKISFTATGGLNAYGLIAK